jgi:hypothetical protein
MIACPPDAGCTRDAAAGNRPITSPGGFIESDKTPGEGDAAMVTRLSASDASFYHLENTSTPMYVG